MTLETILNSASRSYDPDGFPPEGDTLALFIQSEIKDTYSAEASDKDQINEAVRVMDTASKQLKRIALDLVHLHL